MRTPQLPCLLGVALATAATAHADWRDDFDGPELNPRWTWQVPVPGPTVSLNARPGWLRLTLPAAPSGFNHWVGDARAPFLRTDVPAEGDWDLTARLSLADWKPDSNLHLALVTGFSQTRVLAWGPFLSRSLYADTPNPGVWAEPTGAGNYLHADLPVRDVELRIAKRVATYHLLGRATPEAEWREFGVFYEPQVPRFVGLMGKSFGRDPGSALEVDAIEWRSVTTPTAVPVAARLTVGPENGRRLDPRQRGFFLEHLGHCIFRGLWDERLENRQFTGAAPPSGAAPGWEPFGTPAGLALDRQVFLAEPQSQRLELDATAGGVQQRGLQVQAGTAYAVRLVYRAAGQVRQVRVALTAGDQVLVAHPFEVGPPAAGEWQTVTAELRSPRDAAAALAIIANGPGQLWVGAASLMRADHVSGFRRDALEATRLAQPPTFRWPGGNMASGYHWRDGVGPRDARPTRWDRAWSAWVPNDMGTDEYLEYCRLLGAEPRLCANAGEGTVEEAAAWVEYCNGPVTTPMGALRAANGHPEPYGVRVWDIGNEMWGSWQLGHLSPELYGLRVVEFARAMRRVDPNLTLIACGVPVDQFERWNQRLLPICAPVIDMLSVHDYTDYDSREPLERVWPLVVGAPLRIERLLAETSDLAAGLAGKPLPLTLDEWNTTPRDPVHGGTHGLMDALYAAGLLNALERLGERVPTAHLTILMNVLGALRTDQTTVLQTATFLVFRLYAEQSGRRGLAVDTQAEPVFGLPGLDAAASLAEDGRTLFVTVVNRSPTAPAQIRWDLGGRAPAGPVRVSTLSGREPRACNLLDRPAQVILASETLSWEAVQARPLPPASVSGLTIPLAAP